MTRALNIRNARGRSIPSRVAAQVVLSASLQISQIRSYEPNFRWSAFEGLDNGADICSGSGGAAATAEETSPSKGTPVDAGGETSDTKETPGDGVAATSETKATLGDCSRTLLFLGINCFY